METQIERIDSYIKHHFQLLVTWFTFFVTVNWATLGWLATNTNNLKTDGDVNIIVHIFAYQTVLALILCFFSISYFSSTHKKLKTLEEAHYQDPEHIEIFDLNLYRYSIIGIMFSILPLSIFWFSFLF